MKFLIAIHRPNDYDHSVEITEEVMADIDQVNKSMVDAGIRLFVGGLTHCSSAKSINRDLLGNLSIKDGPYLDAANYVDGFWVLELPTVDEAVEWGKKAATACRGSVEVRSFN